MIIIIIKKKKTNLSQLKATAEAGGGAKNAPEIKQRELGNVRQEKGGRS